MAGADLTPETLSVRQRGESVIPPARNAGRGLGGGVRRSFRVLDFQRVIEERAHLASSVAHALHIQNPHMHRVFLNELSSRLHLVSH